tara:strand:+ start:1034 stop:1885 length:852 start_codon:yes stop_codon:yes gene_type:complete
MKIISIITNNAQFIEMQFKTLKKFIKEDYEYIVFNDGKDWPDITNFGNINLGKISIINKCKELNIPCINIPNDNHKLYNSASRRHVDSLTYIHNYMKNNKDEYLLLDGDMFLISELDLNIYRKYHSAFVVQDRPNLKYMWGNFFYLNLFKIPNIDNIDFSFAPGGDSASATNSWLSSYKTNIPDGGDIRHSTNQYTDDYFYYIKHLWSCSWNESELPSVIKNKNLIEFLKKDVRNNNNKFFCEIYDDKFFHYRAGTNWMNNLSKYHSEYLDELLVIVNELCKD